jgi:hypothetical protein
VASTTYKVDNGEWVDWLTDMPETGATYMGRTGKWLTLYVTVIGHLQRTGLSRHIQCHHALPYVGDQGSGVVYYLHIGHTIILIVAPIAHLWYTVVRLIYQRR